MIIDSSGNFKRITEVSSHVQNFTSQEFALVFLKELPKRFCEIGPATSTRIREPISRIEISKHIPLISKNILETTVRNFPAKRISDSVFGMLKIINLQCCLSFPQDEVGFTRPVLNKRITLRVLTRGDAHIVSKCDLLLFERLSNCFKSCLLLVTCDLNAKEMFFVLIYLPSPFSIVKFNGWENLSDEREILGFRERGSPLSVLPEFYHLQTLRHTQFSRSPAFYGVQ